MANKAGERVHPWSTPDWANTGWAEPLESQNTWVVGWVNQALTTGPSRGAWRATASSTVWRGRVLNALVASKASTVAVGMASASDETDLWTSSHPAFSAYCELVGPTSFLYLVFEDFAGRLCRESPQN